MYVQGGLYSEHTLAKTPKRPTIEQSTLWSWERRFDSRSLILFDSKILLFELHLDQNQDFEIWYRKRHLKHSL